MMLSKTLFAVVASTAALASYLLGESAQAIPINGSITFTGSGSGTQGGGTSTLTFNPMMVSAGTFDYSSIPPGMTVNFAPLTWSGAGNTAVLISPAFPAPQWLFTLGGTTYQFSPLALTNALMDTSLGTLSLSGTGVAFITGTISRDPTPGTFSIQGVLDDFTYTVASAIPSVCNTAPCPQVPEAGSSISLVVFAVTGLALLRRKWSRNA
jgi:hypothetical protein